jgi:hypothetical protein
MWTWQYFSSYWTYWEEICIMTFDWSSGIVKVQHYTKTNLHNDNCKLKIIMKFKIYINNDKIPWDFLRYFNLLIDRNKCLRLSPLSSCKNTIYYFIVCKMGMPHYNLKYSYWKRCSISRHHITAQTFCILSLSPGPQSSRVPPCKISFGGPAVPIYNNRRLSV